jgi:SAM-dependent methyltransferase
MDIRGYIWKHFAKISWRSKAFGLLFPGIDCVDWIIRRFNGMGHLPRFSIRTRSTGIGGQMGGRQFVKRGEEIVRLLVDHSALGKGDNVFEIGCGCGSAAFALAKILDNNRYAGIDIDKPSIEACSTNSIFIEKGFQFSWIDIYHPFYNPSGTLPASEYRFPRPEGQTDLVFLVSVFTHMLPEDVSNYIHGIGRILKKGGRCFFTTFLMDLGDEGYISFPYHHESYCLNQESNPAKAVGYFRRFFTEQFASHGMSSFKEPQFGSWRFESNQKPSIAFGQDAMIFVKA